MSEREKNLANYLHKVVGWIENDIIDGDCDPHDFCCDLKDSIELQLGVWAIPTEFILKGDVE